MMMPNRFDPFAWWGNALSISMMMAEANAVVTMRLMGMGGVWSVTKREDSRMLSEKVWAVTKSSTDMQRALMRGDHPDAVTAAAILPFRRTTRANSRRLAKRGLKRT